MKKIVVILVVMAIGFGAWFLLRGRGPAAEEEAKPVAEVQVALLQMQAITRTLPAFGVVEAAPSGARAITLGYDCVVKEIEAGPGSRVDASAPILVVEPTPDAQMLYDSARAESMLADKALASARERFQLRLAASPELFSAQQAAEDARIKLESLSKRGLGLDGRVLAAQAGIVTKLDWQPGATVPAGTALVTVAAVSGLEAHLAIELADAAQVRAGQAVTLTSSNRAGAETVASSVRLVGSNADPVSGAADIRVPIPAESGWFPGEHVQAAIEVERKTALAAPRSAVLPDGDKQVLFTVKGATAVKHEVKIGIAGDDAVEVIADDLHAGDAVVTLGNYELEDGMGVKLAATGPGGDGRKAGRKAGGKADEAGPKAEAKP
jgi:RND family efflux transporter MFP subunit